MQGDNLVTAVLTGPGIVFIQSLPFHRLSQRIARYFLGQHELVIAYWLVCAVLLAQYFYSHSFCSDRSFDWPPPLLLQGCNISKHEGQSKVLPSDSDFLLSCLCCGCVIVNLDGHMRFFFVLGFHRKSRRCSLTSDGKIESKRWVKDLRKFYREYVSCKNIFKWRGTKYSPSFDVR